MERNYIKDNCNRILGWSIDNGSVVSGFDHLGKLKGSFDKRFKTTMDVCGRVVSRGDTLVALILAR